MLQSSERFDIYGERSEAADTESEHQFVSRGEVEAQTRTEAYFKFKEMLGEEF